MPVVRNITADDLTVPLIGLFAPAGAEVEVSDEDAALLAHHPNFEVVGGKPSPAEPPEPEPSSSEESAQ